MRRYLWVLPVLVMVLGLASVWTAARQSVGHQLAASALWVVVSAALWMALVVSGAAEHAIKNGNGNGSNGGR